MIIRRPGGGPLRSPGPPSSPSGPPTSPLRRPVREVTETTIRASPPRLARDKVLMLLSDGCYHSVHEISKLSGLEAGVWYAALAELIEHNYVFARRANSLVLLAERRTGSTPPQDLAELLAGIDASKPEPGMQRMRPSEQSSEDRVVVKACEDDANAMLPSEPEVDRSVAMKLSEIDVQLSAKDYIVSTRAILARKSSGKTYLAMVIAEEILRISNTTGTPMPFVAFDPTGVWYGLCADVNGLPSPHKILRLGGRHGDFPLRFEEGGAVARMVVGCWPLSVILDVSDMLPEEQHQFFGDFGNQLYTLSTKPIHFFIDEADDVMPQAVESGNKAQRRALGVGDRIVRRARVKGIGVTLITQRPAVISKNVLSQVDGVFFLQVSAPHDLEAVDSWMKPAVTSSDRQLALGALPSLERGEAFFVQAHKKAGALIQFKTRAKQTFDSSRTPTVDDPDPPVPSLSRIDQDIWEKVSQMLGHSHATPTSEDDGEREVEPDDEWP